MFTILKAALGSVKNNTVLVILRVRNKKFIKYANGREISQHAMCPDPLIEGLSCSLIPETRLLSTSTKLTAHDRPVKVSRLIYVMFFNWHRSFCRVIMFHQVWSEPHCYEVSRPTGAISGLPLFYIMLLFSRIFL